MASDDSPLNRYLPSKSSLEWVKLILEIISILLIIVVTFLELLKRFPRFL